ncbi:putative porin [Bacteroidales bacterium OttesenSCG-928-I21]|nr:putative porin [Bacteroidales bacterium OttesenSCG-928-I21]
MKKYLCLAIILLSSFLSVFAYGDDEKTDEKVSPNIYTWSITENLGTKFPSEIRDTAIVNFQNTTTDHIYSIANAFNGNMGSPLEPKIYFDRKEKSDFLFMKPYTYYYKSISDYNFFNTKTPYTNISYYRAGSSRNKEEKFNALFSVNAGPKFNFGGFFDYIYGRGVYLSQSTNHRMGGVFASYTGKRYESHLVASLNNFRNYENGGIENDLYITDPQEMQDHRGTIKPEDISVNLPGKPISELKNRLLYYTQKYHLGFERVNVNDSAKMDYVPVTTFIHTVKYEIDNKGYRGSDMSNTDFYEHIYLDSVATQDTARYRSLKNTFAITLNEGFNKFARFGFTAFISNDLMKFHYLQDSLLHSTTQSKTSIGGILSKHQGNRLKYDISGEACVLGDYIGEFNVSGDVFTLFPIKKDTLVFSASGFIKNRKPDFFIEHYESNHFKWNNNNFDDEFKTNVSGSLALPTRRFEFSVGLENLTNYIYFNESGVPAQDDGNIQILALNLRKDFRFGPFGLENRVIYQKSSNQNALPLPDLSLYHNLYFIKKFFSVLTIQLGVDVHYHTEYYAPFYMPATGQFQVQQEKKVGNYPVVNVYGNFHLKRMRFFLMYYHANYNISEPNYFSMPRYPINPSMFKLGISWNFYD